ncbi:LysR family transcriptional regulator [Microvirga arabica]|uniref:LysR family transcriptional regulator n=1 Tax=Microvirga arabica TaxID=1128671 RepID=A0ABV6Y9P0_9HYPH
MDRLEAMSILVAVVEAGSFTGASRRLKIPLPTVSRKLAELEEHIGTRLLTRSTRRLTLTDAGATYVAACKRILDEIGEAERAAAGEHLVPKGELVITAPIVFGRLHVVPVVSEFLETYPDITIRMLLSDRNVHLLEDHVDVALRIGTLPDSSMVATRVGTVRQVVCGSPDYFARNGIPPKPADLADMACVTFDVLGSRTTWTFTGGAKGRNHTVAVRSRLSVNTAGAALAAATLSVGVTRVLSYQAASAVQDGLLRIVLEAFEPEPLPVYLLHGTQGPLPLKMRSFLDFAVPRLRRRLAAGPVSGGA